MAVTVLCADYPRVMPLASGAVPADFTLSLGRRGCWPDRAEILQRSLNDPSVAGGEASMGIHLRRMDQGDRSVVALPVFVLRNFAPRDLYVRQGAGLTDARQLVGKRIGMYSWTASGSIWYRHFLDWAGVPVDAVQWCIGNIDTPWGQGPDPTRPAQVAMAPSGRSLSQMLLEGELDAIYSPPRPESFLPEKGPIVRLYEDPRPIEEAYFKATGVFPPQHLLVLQRAAWERDPALARRVTAAFIACEEHYQAQLESFPYVTPWTELDVERTQSSMGANPYAHGLRENHSTMEQFCDHAFRLGLTGRRVSVEEYFREYLELCG